MRTPIKRLILSVMLAIVLAVAFPAAGLAQPHGHPGGHGGHARVVVGGYYPYYPYYPFYFGLGWGWGYPYWGYPYPYYPYPYYGVDPGGSLKLEIRPRQAEVYVDGYYAGIVDNFDGTFQRLHTTPGDHEITLYLDGYRTVHQKLYVQPNVTTKLKYDMEKLAPGEQPEARPQPPNPPSQTPDQYPPRPPDQYPPPRTPDQYPPRAPYPPPQGQQPPPQGPPSAPPRDVRVGPAAFGTLSVRVQPGGADVMIDGEKWNGPEGQERLFVELPEGRHVVEIRKSGFMTYVTEVDVRRGETATLNVSLRSQGGH